MADPKRMSRNGTWSAAVNARKRTQGAGKVPDSVDHGRRRDAESLGPCQFRLPKVLGYVTNVGQRPDGVAEQEAPTVGVLHALCQFHHTRVRDQSCLENPIILLEQDRRENVEFLGGQIAKRPKLSGIVVRCQPPALNLVTHLGGVGGVGGATEGAGQAGGGFGDMLGKAIGSVSADQEQASVAARDLATGQASDPTAVVMAVERAQLSMQLASQIRSKVVEAAQDIFHSQV